MTISPQIELITEQTQSLLAWAETIENNSNDPFSAAQQLTRKLGAHYRADGLTEFGFWVADTSPEPFYLEIFTGCTAATKTK